MIRKVRIQYNPQFFMDPAPESSTFQFRLCALALAQKTVEEEEDRREGKGRRCWLGMEMNAEEVT